MSSADLCSTRRYVHTFIKDHSFLFNRDNAIKDGSKVDVSRSPDGLIISFSHEIWDKPITLNLKKVDVCRYDDTTMGSLLIYYVIGVIARNMKRRLKIDDIVKINDQIDKKIIVLNEINKTQG